MKLGLAKNAAGAAAVVAVTAEVVVAEEEVAVAAAEVVVVAAAAVSVVGGTKPVSTAAKSLQKSTPFFCRMAGEGRFLLGYRCSWALGSHRGRGSPRMNPERGCEFRK
jgi:hypothetical protein